MITSIFFVPKISWYSILLTFLVNSVKKKVNFCLFGQWHSHVFPISSRCFLLLLFLFKLLHILSLYTILESRTKFIIIVSYRGIKELCLCQCLLVLDPKSLTKARGLYSYCFLGLWNMELKVDEENILIIFNIFLLIPLHLINNTALWKKGR